MISTVVFDADETLVDIRPAIRSAMLVVLDEMRRLNPAAQAVSLADLEADESVAFVRMRAETTETIRRYALARSLARAGLADELDRITDLFFAHRFALTRLYAGVPELLRDLRASYAVGYATNGNNHTHRIGLTGDFTFEVYALVDGVPKKPAAGFFDAVVNAAGCRPSAIVHVGDNWEHDVAGAAAAGLRTIWLNRAGQPRPPDTGTAPGTAPDAEIRSLADLPATLADLASPP